MPRRSGPRASLVVYDTEYCKAGTRVSTLSINDDLPAPDGADTTISPPLIAGLPPGAVPRARGRPTRLPDSLDILGLLPELFHFGLYDNSGIGDCQVVRFG